MNKYLIKLQLPIIALVIISLIYTTVTIINLENKTNSLEKQNQKLQSEFNSQFNDLTLKINSDSNQFAGYKTKVDTLKNQVIAPQIFAANTIESATLTKIITKTETKEIEKNQVTVTIQNVGSFAVDIQTNDNAFTILKRASEQNHFQLSYDQYSFGVFITIIGGIKPTGNQYWAFYYNGVFSNVGASSQQVQKNDSIFWQLAIW